MSNKNLISLYKRELSRLDTLQVTKRREKVITGFRKGKALIDNRSFLVFNSNDYLGLRFRPELLDAEHLAAEKYGTGPGAVRFISGTLKIYQELEKALASFHQREAAMIFSSAFAANLAAISCLIKGQNKDSLVNSDTLVISDELNHRSIVEGIRVANLPDTQKIIFPHFNLSKLEEILYENAGKYSRVLIITDGVFSMLGEFQKLKKMREICDNFNDKYSQGVLLLVDDCHGIGVLGKSGGGVEEISGVKSDVLVGTLGKAFGADGGYVTGDRILIDYLRESAATYIYSNPISPGTAGAALAAVRLIRSPAGKIIITGLQKNIYEFKRLLSGSEVVFAADSSHAIQPLLLGNTAKAKALESYLFRHKILTTSITYPVVPKGRDEIRVQLSAAHTRENLKYFAKTVNNFYN